MSLDYLKEGLKLLDLQESIDESLYTNYIDLLLEWNEKINLTRITEPKEMEIKHFLDSLSLLLLPYFNEDVKVLDLGTGAGFPGFPLKFQRPNLEITLMDSLNKRVKFLKEVIDQLDLEKIKAVHGRAEEVSRTKEYREQYDVCVSRAVARLDTLCEYCIPFVKVGGHFIAMKAEAADEEVNEASQAIKTLGGELIDQLDFTLPPEDARSLIVIEKIKPTPQKYPRGGGKPRKKPL